MTLQQQNFEQVPHDDVNSFLELANYKFIANMSSHAKIVPQVN